MANLKIMALGGLGENGKNLYIVENDDYIFILDAGLRYPDIDMYGIDAVVPDLDYLIKHKDKIAGIFVSHGHEDNIGAIPYLLSNIPMNVYGTHFTISLVENLLIANKMDIKKYRLYRINENKVLIFKNTKIEFFNTTHGIPESVGIVISTPDGAVVYATDFNFNPTNDEHYQTSFSKITDFGKKKILALLSESVGTTSLGRVNNDMMLEHNFNNCLTNENGRIIVAAYSSDLKRIQKIINLIMNTDRKVAFVGDKGEKFVETAMLNNYLKVPENRLVKLKPYSETNHNDSNNTVIIVHGQREEVYSLLVKMVLKEDRYIHLDPSDKIIVMCPPVSGTEKFVTDAINTLYRYDMNMTVYDRTILRPSHATGDDLKLLYSVLKPKYIIPIKGEYRHMYEQWLVAESFGYSKDRVLLADNGEVLNFVDGNYKESTHEHVGDVFVDGSLIGDVNEDVIKERETLSSDGALVLTVYYDIRKRQVIDIPKVITKGLVGKLEDEELSKKVCDLAKSIFENSLWRKNYSLEQTTNTISEEVTRLIFRMTKHKPLVILVTIEVNKIKERN